MDYYEEFGVPPDASLEQIRQAHKRLAWLLHPDRLQDPELRRLAECQMKRLNAIYSVLADPERRREYDLARQPEAAGIVPPVLPVENAAPPRGWRRNGVWAMAAAACAFTLYWTFAYNPARGPQAAALLPVGQAALEPPQPPPQKNRTVPGTRRRPAGQRNASDTPAAPAGPDTEELRRALKQVEAQRDAVLAQMARLRLSLNELQRFGEAPPTPGAAAPPAPGSAAETPPSSTSPRLAGTWFYVPQTVDFASKDLYPPEYIDLIISEENGIIRGRYWARYRVPDRAISPEVFFRFQGEANESGLYSWKGRGGASGEIRLTLISDEELQVVWLANELGRQMGLGSGTAVLIRQRRPERY